MPVEELRRINETQARILYWGCKGSTNREIAGILGITEQAITPHIEKIADVYGIRTDLTPKSRFIEAQNIEREFLLDLIKDPTKDFEGWPRIVDEWVMAKLDEEAEKEDREETKVANEKTKAQVEETKALSENGKKNTNFLRNVGIAIVVIIIVTLAFLAGNFFRPLAPVATNPPQLESPEVDIQTRIVTVVVTASPEPTSETIETEVPVVPPISTSAVPPTAETSQDQTETSVPSSTTLFFDGFTGGKSEQWQEIYGDPDILGDSLTFSERTLMVLSGSEEWDKYQVSFDLSSISCQGAVSSRGVTVGFRYQDPNNMAGLAIFQRTECNCSWYIIEGNEWNRKPNSEFPLIPRGADGVRHFEITVEGNFYTAIGGPTVEIDEYESGPLALIADREVIIDNFEVTELP
jgi:hypothetical protein